jgi:acyl transferase domain-containing protein/NADPH:quinone reductase-like Zn-dependent oxidoreductase
MCLSLTNLIQVVVDSFPKGLKVNGRADHKTSHCINLSNGATKKVGRFSLDGLAPNSSCSHFLLLFSANTAPSLKRQFELYTGLAARNPADLEDIAYTRALRRERLPQRSFSILGPDGRLLKSSDPVRVSTAATPKPKLVMVFSGQGAQWLGMGKEILSAVPELKAELYAMDMVLQSLQTLPDWLVVDALCNPSMSAARLNTAELSQPLCTALQILLLHYLRRLDIVPDAVVGHSSGEIAAAYAAGHISMEMAIKAAFFRGMITKDSASRGKGGMAVVGLGAKEIQARWLCEGVVVACENSPCSTTISGDKHKVEEVLSLVKENRPEVFTRVLPVDTAYHSHHMEESAQKYLELLKTHEPSRNDTYFDCQATFVSSVTHEKMDIATTSRPDYWVHNLVKPVLFSKAIEALHRNHGDAVLLELGPHATLGGPLRQIYDRKSWTLRYIATQKRLENCYTTLLDAVGQLYQQDFRMDLQPLFSGRAISGLPPYPWDYTGPPLLHESRISKAYRFRKYPRHCLLGLRSPESPDTQPTWRNILDIDDLPWLLDHKVGNDTVFPIAGYMATVGEAIRQLGDLPMGSGYCLRNVVADTALILKESHPVELITSLQPKHRTMAEPSAWFEFQIRSYSSSQWMVHCAGQVIATTTPPVKMNRSSNGINGTHPTTMNLDNVLPALARRVSRKAFYSSLERIGISYGPRFALLNNITASTNKQLAQGYLADTHGASGGPFSVHPAEMDACLHLLFTAATQGLCRRLNQLYVPTAIDELTVHMFSASDMVVRAEMNEGDFGQSRIDCLAPNGDTILSVHGVHMAPVEQEVSIDGPGKHGLARLEWHPAFDFGDRTSLLRPPPVNREHCKIQQELAFLCMLEEADNVRMITPTKPHFAALRDWMSTQIRTDAFPLVDDKVELAQLSKSERQELVSKHCTTLRGGRYAPFAEACQRVSTHGAALFSGQSEIIDILTRENLLTELYTLDSYKYGQFVRSLAKTRTNLRVLEVGAGTGGTTENILHDLMSGDSGGLSPYSTYTFTDVSSGFFSKAKERFGYAPNLEYRVLDISRPPSEQGFKDQGHSYDLVIAANVVHATPRIGETLANIRWLLKPGGILLLTELLPTLKTTSYIFGHFSGWWLGESDDRDDGSLIGLEKWDRRLKGSGFTGTDSVVYDAEEPYGQAITIVSHTPHGDVEARGSEKQVTLLCTDPSSGVSCRLSTHLQQRGWTVKPERLTTPPIPPNQYMISCVDLEASCFSADLNEDKFETLKALIRNINKSTLWLMPPVQTGSKQPWAAQILGFIRTLRSELGAPIFTLEVEDNVSDMPTDLILDVFEKVLSDADTGILAPDTEYAIKDSQVLVPRFHPLSFEEAAVHNNEGPDDTQKRKVLGIQKRGLLNTIYWKEAPVSASVPDGHVEVDIRAVGLNAYDVLSAKGIIFGEVLPDALRFGCEASGVIRRVGAGVDRFHIGDRVMLITDGGCLATNAIISSDLVYHIPDSMDFAQAATIPVCFGTVLYSLVQVGKIERGQSVLIHSACGGVGLTAIQVCQMLGADMYATVGSEEKAQYLVKTFGIPRERIFSSRDKSFFRGIMHETKGVGVDLVLNSLSGDLLHESWNCVAKFGTMIELSVKDINSGSRLDMLPFGENRSYVGVEAIKFVERPALLAR